MEFWDTAKGFYSDLLSRRQEQLAEAGFSRTSLLKGESQRIAHDHAISTDYKLQKEIRPIFCKEGINPPAFGDHPDFIHLRGTKGQEKGAVSTLFVDIEGSTKLGILYPPEQVFMIKNAIIRCAIETIQAFDGHVHRIMGDAVLAYFRSKNKAAEDSAIDAINCSSFLVEFTNKVVLPNLASTGADHDFGIRIGVDYGSHDDVLWGSYGYPGMEEVTATSFYVDSAAKLQHSAGRNRIMLGQGIRDLLDFPNDVWNIKTRTKDGKSEELPYLSPNYTRADGKPINYKQYLLSQKNYWSILPIRNEYGLNVTIKEITAQGQYALTSCSRSLPKTSGVLFDVRTQQYLPEGSKLRFRVENHGEEAFRYDPVKGGAHTTKVDITRDAYYGFRGTHSEELSYRGLHYMHISVIGKNELIVIPEQTFGVYVR